MSIISVPASGAEAAKCLLAAAFDAAVKRCKRFAFDMPFQLNEQPQPSRVITLLQMCL